MPDRPPWPAAAEPQYRELDAVLRSSPLLRHLGGELVAWGPGWAEVRLPAAPELGNLVGTVHGGIVATIADAAFEAACNSYGRISVAVSIAGHFTAPAALGTVLTARAEEVARSHGSGSYRIDVEDADGVRVAWFQALAHRTRHWHLGENAWPAEWREVN